MSTHHIDQFRAAMQGAGIPPPEQIIDDGKLHRFRTNGKAHDDAGWYLLHGDGIPAGAFGCWRSGVSETFRADIGRELTAEETQANRERMESLRRDREAERERRHAEARQRAREILTAATPAPADHEYLRRKAIKPPALKVHDGALIVPLRDERGLCNLQLIYPDGTKRFLPGGKVSGAFHEIGESGDRVAICEGAATGYSIHEATGLPVRCAMSAGNLLAIAELTRRESQSVKLTIAGDNDENGTGQRAAEEAARAVGARLAIPSEAGADWNDVAVADGLEAVRVGIESASTAVPDSGVDAPTEPPAIEEIPLAAYAADATGSDGRHVIQLAAGQLHRYAEETERLIASDIYVRARQLARIGTPLELAASLRADIIRDQEQRVIVPVSAEYLRRRLNTLAEFQKYSKREKTWFPVDCPGDLVTNILGYGDWQHFRPLEGIATAPFLRADLTICATPGYDAASRVYYAPTVGFPPIPQHPNKDDAEGALERLLEPFGEFPFATDEARAAYLSHILAAAARHAIDTRPVYVYSAPLAATGKTLLSGMPVRIADGIEPAMKPYTDESEEMRKVLMSVLLAGDSAIYFDNVPSGAKVRSAILCGFVTAAVYGDRKLGVSESLRLPNHCQVALTGNNISPTGDLARRAIVVRLDANAETARGRSFRIADLKAHIRQHRIRLLVDALTVIRAYSLASDPVTTRPLESFEQWSRVARDPLIWLGYGDAVETQQLETDDEIQPLISAFDALGARSQFSWPAQFGASDIAMTCNGIGGEDLRQAIQAAGCSDASNAKTVGYWLRAHRDQMAGTRKLVQQGRTHGASRYRLREGN